MKKTPAQTEQALRQRAERLLDASAEGEFVMKSTSKVKKLLQELQVHQIELEMQNEELRGAQQQLDASRARYFELYDLAPIGYLTIDSRHLIKKCNLCAAKMMGVNRSVLTKAPISKILLKEDQIIFYDNLKLCHETEGPQHFEMRLIRADGAVFWGLLQVMAMQSGDYGLTIADISKNKQVAAKLQQSENKFRSIFEQAAVGVASVGLDGSWLQVNKKLCDIVGYSQQALLSKRFQDLTHPEDLPMDQVAVNQLINNKISTYSKEKRYYTNIGDIIWVNVATSLVRDNTNQPDHFIFVIEDITTQKNATDIQITLTEQLHQAQKIEAIGNLAGGIAHDFNNMLGVILGQAELAMNKLDNTDPLIKNIQAITKAANHSAKLTRQLLTFARKQKIEPKVLNLNSSVAAMMGMLKRLIGESIIFSWDPAPDLWSVKVDPTHIDQVLANLCINARDAITGNGEISITARNCTLDEKNTITKTHEIPLGEYVKLSITDNGCGMNEATKARIFEPFYTTKARGEGTGLGLSFTLGAVKTNAGFINVFSELGKGTTFDIYFQRVSTLKETKQHSIETPRAQGTETILLVEDEEILLEVETDMLENNGYKVIATSGGERAEALFHKHLSEIDLLITDVVMPKVNGMDLAVKLRVLSPKLKVLFMSGYPADVLGKKTNLKEDAHFLQKPFSMQVLTTKIREVLDTNK